MRNGLWSRGWSRLGRGNQSVWMGVMVSRLNVFPCGVATEDYKMEGNKLTTSVIMCRGLLQ